MKKFFGGGSDKPATAPIAGGAGGASSSSNNGHGSKLSISSNHGLQAPSAHSQDTSSHSSSQFMSRPSSKPASPGSGFLPNGVDPSQNSTYFDRPFAHTNGSGFFQGAAAAASGRPGSNSSAAMNDAPMGFVNLPNGSGFLGVMPQAPASPAFAPVAMPVGDGLMSAPTNAPNGPAAIASQAQIAANTPPFDRGELHKSLKALENLLVSLDEYRDLASKMAKVEKKVSRAASELARSKLTRDIPAQTLIASATLFSALEDVSSKHAKYIQKEYENVNDQCAKYFKRVAKEEKAYEDTIDSLDSKVKKAHASHEKNAKKSGTKAIESHDKYIASVTQLTNEIGAVKAAHGASLGSKGHATNLAVASCIAGMADAEFRTLCERVRATGPSVGRINELLNFAVTEAMPNMQPADLAEDALGPAAILAAANAQAEMQVAQRRAIQEQAKETAQLEWAARQMGWVPPQEQIQLDQYATVNGKPAADSKPAESRPPPAASATTAAANVPPANGGLSRSASVSSQQRGLLPKLDSSGQLVKEEEDAKPAQTSAAPAPSVAPAATAPKKDNTIKAAPAAQSQPPVPAPVVAVKESGHSRPQNSSTAEGTIIENRLQPSQDSDAPVPSLTTSSNSRLGSDDPMPRTPQDGRSVAEDPPSKPNGHHQPAGSYVDGGLLGKFGFERGASLEGEQGKVSTKAPEPKVEPPPPEPSVRSNAAADPVPVSASVERNDSIKQPPISAAERHPSAWQKDAAIREVSHSGSAFERSDSIASRGVTYAQEVLDESTPRGTLSQKPTYDYARPDVREDMPSDRDRYGPVATGSRMDANGAQLNRNVSTDSERSFVARMRARYQAEKAGAAPAVAEERPYNSGGSQYGSGRPSSAYAAQSPRVVSQPAAASRYADPPRRSYDQPPPRDDAYSSTYSGHSAARPYDDRYGSGAAPPRDWDQQQAYRRPYDSLPPGSPGRNMAGRGASGPAPPSEFGSIRSERDHRPPPVSASAGYASRPTPERSYTAPRAAAATDDQPHSSVCGCAKCSARHYGSGGTSSSTSKPERASLEQYRAPPQDRYADTRGYYDNRPPPASYGYSRGAPPPAAGTSSPRVSSGPYYDSRPPASRRQSLPPPGSSINATLPPAAAAAPGRASPYQDYDYGRREYDDDPSKHVAFASTTETIR